MLADFDVVSRDLDAVEGRILHACCRSLCHTAQKRSRKGDAAH